jgi:epoxide hydrolase
MVTWVIARLPIVIVRPAALPHRIATGFTAVPGEPFQAIRPWAERALTIQHWSVPPRGGHFAAMEEPELFVEDVRAFFRTVR